MTLLQLPHPSTAPVVLGYQDIHTHFHTLRFPLLKTITVSYFPKVSYSLECPASPHTSPSHLGANQQRFSPGDPCLSLNTSFCFYLLTILTLFSHCTNSFRPFFFAFISANLLQHLVYWNSWFQTYRKIDRFSTMCILHVSVLTTCFNALFLRRIPNSPKATSRFPHNSILLTI